MSQAGSCSIRIRSAFISDIHLGTRECQADELLAFLATVEVEQLFLVGDVVDLWSMRKRIYWPASHQEVLRAIVAKAREGTRVIFIPGNHDDLARSLCGSLLAGVEVHREYVHTTAKGQRMLVVHGDDFDGAVRFSPLLKMTGDLLYTVILVMNRALNGLRRPLGLPRWSLATWIKSRVGKAIDYVRRFEDAAAHAAASRGLDGVICGHIHRPQIAQRQGVLYCNDGDWVEHCTALIEDRNGELRLWERPLHSERVLSFAAPVAAAGR